MTSVELSVAYRLIGQSQQVFRRLVQPRIKLDLPDTEANVIATMRRGIALIEYFFEARPDRGDFHGVGAGQQGSKLIAAEPADHIAFTKGDA
jgi:hypothetical protein